MQKQKVILCILCLQLFIVGLLHAQTAKVWVTIPNESDVPYLTTDSLLQSNDSVFNAYIHSLHIFSCEKALPSSRIDKLQHVYEISCHCSFIELKSNLANHVNAVSGVERAPEYDTLHIPNDYNLTTSVNNYALNLINAPSAWDLTKGDSNVVIAITDQGYNPLHSELVGKFVHCYTGSNFTTHGNAVSILAAGNTNNNNGLSSIGYNCKLGLYAMNYNEVLNAAYAGARVINLSWSSGCFYNSYEQLCVDEAYDAGAFLVMAAGNGNTCSTPSSYVYPAAYNHAFAVTSIGENNNHEQIPNDSTSTHQHNDKVDLSAPGYGVAVIPIDGWYINSSGTSYAAPIVSGTIGLMLSINPCLSRKDIDTILRISAFPIDSINPNYAGKLGAGRLDAYVAVQMAAGWTTQPMVVSSQPVSISAPAGTTAQFSVVSSSSLPLYQWQRDSAGIFVNLVNNTIYSGVHTSTLVVNNISASLNNNHYRCIMTSGYCQAISNAATLLVNGAVLPENPGIIHTPASVCFGDTFTISINPVNYATGYNWLFTGNVNIISGQNTNTITIQIYDTATNVTVTPYNANGSSNSATVNISTIPLPTGFLSGNPTICAGDSAVLTLNVTGQGPWSGMINDSILFSGLSDPIQVVVYPDSTTFYVLQTLQTLDGCNAYPDYLGSTASVTVLPYNRDTIQVAVCSSQLPYYWNGNSISSSGFYQDTILSSIGCDTIRTLHLIIINGNVPLAPSSITQVLVSNTCYNRIYRYTAAITTNATGYKWMIPSSCGGIVGVNVVSGDINSSRIIDLSYYSNATALVTDSIRVMAYNSCGLSPKRSAKLINTALNVPAMPSITITPLVTNICGERKYRYTASNLPLATASTAAASGYLWSFSNPNTLQPVIDSGSPSSKIIVVKYISNNAAAIGDSIYLRYNSACGYSAKRALKLAITKLNPPTAPASITINALTTSICGGRRYRLTMPIILNATNVNAAATGYLWSFTGNPAQYIVLDSGTLSSRVIVIRYTNDNATAVGDSVIAQYSSDCGYSLIRSVKFSIPKLNPPLAPSSIVITPVTTNICNNKIYRYTMPLVTNGSAANAAATGYKWEFTGNLAASAIIDSGTINSRIIRMKFINNNAATVGDSVRAYYLSSCGNGVMKSLKLTNANLTAPAAPASISISLVSDVCGARIYRYAAPVLPIATTTTMAATGYEWSLPTGSAVATSVSLDSGVLSGSQARYIKLKFINNGAALTGDSIKVRYTSSCGMSAPKSQKLSNLAITTLPASSTLTGVANICSIVGTSTSARYTASAVPGAVSYLWTLPSGAIIDSGNNGLKIRVIFNAAGSNDSIFVQAFGTNGCAGSKKVLKLVTTGCITLQISRIVNPVITSTEESMDVMVYPNPTTSAYQLFVKSSKLSQTVKARIVDLQGRLIKTLTFNSNETIAFGNELRAGVYMVEVREGDKVKTVRVVKY